MGEPGLLGPGLMYLPRDRGLERQGGGGMTASPGAHLHIPNHV